jgi:hypothetical protein
LDRAAADKETAVLKVLGAGLQQSFLRYKRLPGVATNDWAQMIAASSGYQLSDVLTNGRGASRVYLIDPNIRVGTNNSITLPFNQTSNGVSTLTLTNVRVMLLSSISQALPVSSGSNNTFDTIWSTADGSVPAGWPASWNNRGDDLKIQRISLTPSFKRLILNNSFNAPSALYSIDGSTPALVSSNTFDRWFIEGTVLSLFSSTNGVPDANQILTRDTTFTMPSGGTNWTGNILGWPGSGGGSGSSTNLDIIVKLYMSTAENPYTHSTPMQGFNVITNFMARYNAWASSGFPSSGAAHTAVRAAETALELKLDSLASEKP